MTKRKTAQDREYENENNKAVMKSMVSSLEAQGKKAFKDGLLLKDNPLPESNLLAIFWNQGWNKAAGVSTSKFSVDWDNVWLTD